MQECEVDEDLFGPLYDANFVVRQHLQFRRNVRALALGTKRINYKIDCLNASLRRVVYKVPHTRRPTPSKLGCRWVLHRKGLQLQHLKYVSPTATAARRRCEQLLRKKLAEAKQAKDAAAGATAKRTPKGGPCRAVLRMYLSGCGVWKLDFKEALSAYKRLSPVIEDLARRMVAEAKKSNSNRRIPKSTLSLGVR